MSKDQYEFDFGSEGARVEHMLARLHVTRQQPTRWSRNKDYWGLLKELQHPLTISPAEQFLPEKPTDPTSASDVAFLKEVGLWNRWWAEGPTDDVLRAVNDALQQARDIFVDPTASNGHTDYGSVAAWAWHYTGHDQPPPKTKKLPPLF